MSSRKIVTPICTTLALMIIVVLAASGFSIVPLHRVSAVKSAEVVQTVTNWDKNCSNCTDYIELNSTVDAGDVIVVMTLNVLIGYASNTVSDTLGSNFNLQVSYCPNPYKTPGAGAYCGYIFTAIARTNGSDTLKVSDVSSPESLQQLVVFAFEVSGVNYAAQSSTFGWCSGNVNNTGAEIFSLSTGPDPDASCPILPPGCVGPCPPQTNPAYLKVNSGDFAASLLSDSAANSTSLYSPGDNLTAINLGGQAVQYSTLLTNETDFPATIKGIGQGIWEDLAIVLPFCPSMCNNPTSTTTTTSTRVASTNTSLRSSTDISSSTTLSSPSLSPTSSFTASISAFSSANSTKAQSPLSVSPRSILVAGVVAVAIVGGSIGAVTVFRRKSI